MALAGIKVIEICYLPTTSSCTTLLLDYGATVLRIGRPDGVTLDFTNKGKPTIPVDLTSIPGRDFVRRLVREADVLIECLRPGNMEKYGLGPEDLFKENPGLIYARFVGYGQEGPNALRAGHDGNFAALSGVLPLLGGGHEKEQVNYPSYLLSFAAGATLCAFGILSAIISRQRTGKGQVVDLSTTEAIAYAATPVFASKGGNVIWRGTNRLFSVDTYETKDGKFMCVCFHEERFFHPLRTALGLDKDPEFIRSADNSVLAGKLKAAFRMKTQSEWTEIFKDVDACVEPVLSIEEAAEHKHNKFRKSFARKGDQILPNPSPRLSETPAKISSLGSDEGEEEEARRVLKSFNLGEEEFYIHNKLLHLMSMEK